MARFQRPEIRIEPALKADHQRAAFGLDGGKAPLRAGHRKIDGLLAEDRLAGAHEPLDQVGVRVGRRADDCGVDVVGALDPVDRADFAPKGVRHVPRGLGHGVGDGDQLRSRNGGDGPSVDLADAACAEYPESDRHTITPRYSGLDPVTFWSKSTIDPVITPEPGPSI